MLKVIGVIILTTLLGCDFSSQVNERVDKGVRDAKLEMSSDSDSAQSSFINLYNSVLRSHTDSITLNQFNNLYFSIATTSKYMDSLRAEVNKLDDKDLRNVELMKQTFLYNGIGDSVFNKVKFSYSLAIEIAISDTTKSRLKKVHDSYTAETKRQFFELNSPLGVNMILYGIESELIKDGTKSLYGY